MRPGEQDLYIKLTYSVIREDVNTDPSISKEAEDKQQQQKKQQLRQSSENLLAAEPKCTPEDSKKSDWALRNAQAPREQTVLKQPAAR